MKHPGSNCSNGVSDYAKGYVHWLSLVNEQNRFAGFVTSNQSLSLFCENGKMMVV